MRDRDKETRGKERDGDRETEGQKDRQPGRHRQTQFTHHQVNILELSTKFTGIPARSGLSELGFCRDPINTPPERVCEWPGH